MKLGVHVGHIMLDGDQALPKKGAQPPIFGPRLLWPNGWMDQGATWYLGRPWLRRRCVRWGPSSPPKGALHPVFGPCLLWPNGWMDEDATRYRSRPQRKPHCVRREPSFPFPRPRKGHSRLPLFWPMSIVATVAHLSYC